LQRPRRRWHESCWFLTCRRRKVDQLYCPKYWEFTKHKKYSGDFLCTINDLDFVVFLLYYMIIPYLDVNVCHSTFPTSFHCPGFSGPGGRWQFNKRGASPQNRSRVPLPCLAGNPGGSTLQKKFGCAHGVTRRNELYPCN